MEKTNMEKTNNPAGGVAILSSGVRLYVVATEYQTLGQRAQWYCEDRKAGETVVEIIPGAYWPS
jgi:hypothetical protein